MTSLACAKSQNYGQSDIWLGRLNLLPRMHSDAPNDVSTHIFLFAHRKSAYACGAVDIDANAVYKPAAKNIDSGSPEVQTMFARTAIDFSDRAAVCVTKLDN